MAIVYEKQSQFQHIQLKHHPLFFDEYVLYLDDSWQLDSTLSHLYHESIAAIPAAITPNLYKVLICGGGDGMAVETLLKFNSIEKIDLIEIDPEMIKLFKDVDIGKKLNNNSLNNHKVNIHIEDAVSFIEKQEDNYYDLIILDFPSPTDWNVSKEYKKLFTPEVWTKFIRILSYNGTICSQVSLTNRTLVPLVRGFLDNDFRVFYWDTCYSLRENHDSFLLATKQNYIKPTTLNDDLKLRFITNEHIEAILKTQELNYDHLSYYRLFLYSEQKPID